MKWKTAVECRASLLLFIFYELFLCVGEIGFLGLNIYSMKILKMKKGYMRN